MANTMSKYGSNTNRPLSEIVGLSTDTKPTDSIEGIQIQNGSSFRELDTGKRFLFDAENTTWNEVSSGGGGGGGSTLIEKSISANGVYNASDDSADGYSKVTVDVANSYTQADEGKVISNGALVAQTTHSEITENGVYDITTNNSVSVNVSATSENNAVFVKGSGTFYIKSCLKKLTVPAGVTELSTGCFDGCSRLENLVLNDEITTLPANCFKNCVFSTIDLKNVTLIGDRIFEGCTNLTNVEIPSTVNDISGSAFRASSLTTITIHKPENSISGAPWGATNATVIWTG